MQTWQIQAAKARISALVKQAQNQPQDITVHGKSVAVVLSRERFDRLSHSHDSLVDFMHRSPLYDLEEIRLEREQTPSRELAL